MADAVRDLGLRGLIGRPVNEVFAAILNSLAPAGATNEEAVARRATNDVLSELFESYGVVDGGLERLDQMDSAAVGEAVEKSVCAFVFERWLLELGKKIEEGAYSDREACRLERDVRAFVRELVHIDLEGKDPISIDWNGAEGHTLCTRIYQEAYRLIGGEQ